MSETVIMMGDRVAYSRAFLRSIACYAGDMPFARGVVTGFESLGPQTTLAVIQWDRPGIPERVNVLNLARICPRHGILDSY